jgi:hypothetical protein
MMQAAEYRLKAEAAFAAANDTNVDAHKRDYQDNAKMWLRLAELAEWQESMRMKGHLPDEFGA